MKEKYIMNLKFAPDDNKPEEVKKVPPKVTQETISCCTMERSSKSKSKWTDHP